MVVPIRIALHDLVTAKDRSASTAVFEEDRNQPPLEIVGDVIERKLASRACRIFDEKVVPVALIQVAKPVKEQQVRWHPDRTTPVRVATEHAGARLSRLV